jgi:cell division initiation protein
MFRDETQTSDGRRLPLAERSMGITPLDVRQAKFTIAMRGFDRQEVSTFLAEAAEGYDQALRENERLRQEVARLEGSLSQFRDLEGSLKNTLLSAQKLADDMRENAAQEAARIVRDAETRAEMVIQKAHARLEDVQREIDGLKMKRREAETGIEASISALNHTLQFIREQDQRDRQEKVVSHRPRIEPLAPVAPAPAQPLPPAVIEAIKTA